MSGTRVIIVVLVVVAALSVALYLLSKPKEAARGTEPLLVYCAAGIRTPVEKLAARFEKEYGVKVQLQYGGSGTLLGNIEVSRAGDIFIAADQSYTDLARRKGLAAETVPLAHLRAVVAVAKGNPKAIKYPDDLTRPEVRLALCNPEAAAVGKLTMEKLNDAGIWELVKNNAARNGVFKPTLPDAANDIVIGAADAAIVWDATVAQYKELEMVPMAVFDDATQMISACVLNASRQPTTALRFARWLNSTVGNEVFRACGYNAVDGDEWTWHPEITFYCGAVNRRSVERVVKAFGEREGVTINAIYNGCGILTGQMRTIRQDRGGTGFPDVYMACDRYYLENVKDWFQEDVDISDTEIVIAVPKGNPRGIKSVNDLTVPGVRVSTGQPEQCTIGALTIILLDKLGILQPVISNVVMQTASSAMLVPSVITKSVDASIAYITDTRAEADKIDIIRIDSPYATAIQPFSIAASSRHKYLGRRFFAALAAARADFEEAGFHFRLQ